jgi:surface antigen/pimeloyl-ACP methyl ester carboxylesterase
LMILRDTFVEFNFPIENQPAIAVIDTGFSGDNPDIDYGRITPLWDWVSGDSNPLLAAGEGNEHGTHTLGLIAATRGNNLGIDGANGTAPIYVSRAVGSGQWAKAVKEFLDRFEAESGQPNPLIYLGFDLTQRDAAGNVSTRYELTLEDRAVLEYARQKGALIVVPSGNDGGVMSALGQAAQEFDNIVTVGAVDGANRASYSSYGAGLTLMAPGGSIDQPTISTVGNGLGTMAGTSVAAARAAGEISQIWAANPRLSYQQVIDVLKATTFDVGAPGWDEETAFGVLDVKAAVELAKKTDLNVVVNLGDGVVPLERASGTINLSSFSSRVITIGVNARVRAEPNTTSAIVDSKAPNSIVQFDAWTIGQEVTELGRTDNRWYRIAGTNYWMSATLIADEPPVVVGPTPPIVTPIPVISINVSSPNYRDGRVNPFAYSFIGQCTWYAYGRMLETGLLPAGAKANGWFLGNAEAWRRDAARAELPVNSRPTPGARGLVVWPPGVQGGSRYGHVAFIEQVNADGTIDISESNGSGGGVAGYRRTLSLAQQAGLAFIPLEGARSNPQVVSPSARPGQQREYRVRAGDTLSGIALRELGNGNRWREIQKADGSTFTESEARQIQVGQSIYLPVSYQVIRPAPVIAPPSAPAPIVVAPLLPIPNSIPLPLQSSTPTPSKFEVTTVLSDGLGNRYDIKISSYDAVKLEDKQTWIVIHGLGHSPSNLQDQDLQQQLKSSGFQVLEVDWSSITKRPPYLTLSTSSAIPFVGQFVGETMRNSGVSTSNINFIGHSFGSYVSWEAAKELNGVNKLVALDPANAFGTIGSYDIGTVDFSGYTNYSWAFKSSWQGNSETANTADESFEVTYSQTPENYHNDVIGFFASLIRRNREGLSGNVSKNLELDDMNINSTPPWRKSIGAEGTIEISKEGDEKYKWTPSKMNYGGFFGLFSSEIKE